MTRRFRRALPRPEATPVELEFAWAAGIGENGDAARGRRKSWGVWVFGRVVSTVAAAVMLLLARGAAADESAVVVMYHRFGEGAFPATSIRLDQFDAHLAELRQGGYTVLPLTEIVAALQAGRPLPERTVAITIDDAWASVYREAWPRLRKAGFPFTVFVSTDDVDHRLPDHMTWEQIRELAASGISIGSQGAAHLHMAAESPEANAADLERASRRLFEELGEPPGLFAWPYGEASAAAMDGLAKAGVAIAFGQHSGVLQAGANMLYLPRFPLNEAFGDGERFRTVVRGRPLPVSDLTPADPLLAANPPAFGFTVADDVDGLERIACYTSHEGRMTIERLGRRVEARAATPFPAGRGRINCTLPDGGDWRWMGYQYYVPAQ